MDGLGSGRLGSAKLQLGFGLDVFFLSRSSDLDRVVVDLGFLTPVARWLPETARTAVVAPVVAVLDAPVVLRTPGGDDGVQKDTTETLETTATSGASRDDGEVQLEDHGTAATFGRARFRRFATHRKGTRA